MERVKIIAVVACLFSGLAIAAGRNLANHSDHHHSGGLKDVGSHAEFSSHINTNMSESRRREMVTVMDLCNATFPTPVDDLIQLNETGEYPPTSGRDSKCYLNCIFTQMRLFDDNGNIDKTVIGKLFADKEEDASRITAFDKCIMEKDKTEDVCEHAYDRVSCLMKGALNYYADGKNRNGKGDKMLSEAGK